jgi:hypothetical protein
MVGKPGDRVTDVVRAGGADPFDWVNPTTDQSDRMIEWRETCKSLRDELLILVPAPNRERSLAITQLEIVMMWGTKAILAGPK